MEAAIEIDLQLCYPSLKARRIDPEAVKKIADSIAECGLLTPITVRKVQESRAGRMTDAFEVIAGMHRVKAFRRLRRETIPAIILDVDDLHAELMLIDENLCRNDLTPAERASAQARRKAIYQELHPETKVGIAQAAGMNKALGRDGQVGHDDGSAPRFDKAAADATGQSERTVRRDVTRGEALGEDVLAKVARTSLDKGEELDALAKLPEQQRQTLIERASHGEDVSAKTALKKEVRDTKEKILGGIQLALPDKKYGVILADPEWKFKTYSLETGMDRSADNHYPTSETDKICARPVADIAADDCALFLWATVPMLPDAFRVMAAWGFEYKSHCIWKKDRIGTGYWFRNQHELLLVGTKGKKLPAPAGGTQFPSVIDAPVGKHSEKPDAFYEVIETYFPTLPKIELNARRARPGWDSWGNQAPLPPHDAETGEVIEQSAPVRSVAIDDPSLDLPEFLRRGPSNEMPASTEPA